MERPGYSHLRTCFCPVCYHENTFTANEGEKPCALCHTTVHPHPYDVMVRVDTAHYYGLSRAGEALTLDEAKALAEKEYNDRLSEVWSWDIQYMGEDIL